MLLVLILLLQIDFVIWSMRRNEILLRIPCGGGHRTWDFHYTEVSFYRVKDQNTKIIQQDNTVNAS